jgi:enediyne biosynthesis protein E4
MGLSWRWLGLGVFAAALVAGGVWIQVRRHVRADLESRRTARSDPQFEKPRRDRGLIPRSDATGESAFLLGQFELARGRTASAIAAWTSVPDGSPFAGRAATARAIAEIRRGRLADAENLLIGALGQPGPHTKEAREALVRLLRSEGRNDEARRLFLDAVAWSPAERPSQLVATIRRLYKVDSDPFPVEGVRAYLTNGAKHAPDDDRVWLGWAHFETRLGRLQEAHDWLARCLERRPRDPAVWRARLDWALAAGRPDIVQQCFATVASTDDSRRLALSVQAWLAARRRDVNLERKALDELRQLDPGDVATLDRLAELEIDAGQVDRATELRRSKAEVERARDAYALAMNGPEPERRARELAELARKLGREFDAAAWSAIANRKALVIAKRTSIAPGGLAGPSPDVAAVREADDKSTSSAAMIPTFRDDAQASGLRFIHRNGALRGRLIPPVTQSGGVALLDFDGDGWLDVYAVQGGDFPPAGASSQDGDRLFRNRRDGTFEDVSESSGVTRFSRGYGHGVAVGDWDNDGDPDLFITRWRRYTLLRNRGDGVFEDVTDAVGLGGDRDWPTSAAFADFDGDGDLDLYVCHYLKWDEGDVRECADAKDPSIYRCGPRDFPALPDHLFRNDGDRFVDVTRESGIVDQDGRGLGVVAADLDGDGQVDLFVANDATANYFFRNIGGFRFEEQALVAGLAANAAGGYQAGMGVACGDLDGDELIDLAVTNFYGESTTYFHNLGKGLFADHTASIGLAAPSRFLLGFGISFLDANNDGYLDVLSANGHVHDGRPQFPWEMPVQLLVGGASGRLTDVSDRSGPPFAVARLGRGLAGGDLDNDGRVDAVVVSQNEPLSFFHNGTAGGHFLAIELEGRGSNRDAIGAVASIEVGGRRRVAQRFGGGSYQSAGDPRIYFGLDSATRVDQLEVRWPSGKVERFHSLAADRGYHLREGDADPRPLRGFAR